MNAATPRPLKPSERYLLDHVSGKGRIRLLDFACSTGALWDHLPENVSPYGCDLWLKDEMAQRIVGREDRFRPSTAPDRIPFDDDSFDIVFANSAFEHVQPIDSIIGECARVLKSGGSLVAIFPCKSVIMEPHVHIPFASWLSNERLLTTWCKLWGKPDAPRYIRENTNYLPLGSYRRMLERHFRPIRMITDELMRIRGVPALPSWLVARIYAAALVAEKP